MFVQIHLPDLPDSTPTISDEKRRRSLIPGLDKDSSELDPLNHAAEA
jgi:hypothetical protein